MRILVLSDSHSALSFMRRCIDRVRPDCVIHLGDYVSDGETIAREYPQIRFYQVAGNCDGRRVPPDHPEIRVECFLGRKIYFTHGHIQKVKQTRLILENEARKCAADVALYGHTHCADCEKLEDGMWIMNPGSCGFFGGSAGLIDIDGDGSVLCRIIHDSDLEEMQ